MGPAYDEGKQSKAHLRRGFRDYHRSMSPIHKQTLLSLEVKEPLLVGSYVIAVKGKFLGTRDFSKGVEEVGKILAHEIVSLMRTSKIYEPPKVHKYQIKWTYGNGWSSKSWVQHKFLQNITKKEYLKFIKKAKGE